MTWVARCSTMPSTEVAMEINARLALARASENPVEISTMITEAKMLVNMLYARKRFMAG